ncbi:MAG: T9SS type A sorting domain-containing protein [Bacteroidetes bacterium]|nr:T9SS type A sorting domain-containing protein [Bacteroidota bacterium]
MATLHDATGRIVRTAMSTGANGDLVLDVRHLPAGLWTLRAILGGHAYTAQFIHLAQ